MSERRLLTSMQRKGGERTRAKLAGKNVRIWSAEHYAWWRPNRSGYCTDIEGAGLYTFEDAWSATRHCGPEKKIIFYVAEEADASDGPIVAIRAIIDTATQHDGKWSVELQPEFMERLKALARISP